ncbi:MAG TPA: phosphotransferase, partial [Candidatus Dormibacteraeota bacterium]|nr:phosphotransferase [Candidatus Dormibacteraeota bacterium]
AFMVMERAPGAPLLGGLSATAVIVHLPRLARRLPMLLADATAGLHAIDPAPVRHRLAAVAPTTATRVSELLRTLTATAEDLGRPDLAGAGRRLAELRPAPGDEVVCHGDLHPFNVLVDGDRVTVIDWTAARIAEPAYDLAFTWLLLADPPLDLPGALRPPIHVAAAIAARGSCAATATERAPRSLTPHCAGTWACTVCARSSRSPAGSGRGSWARTSAIPG